MVPALALLVTACNPDPEQNTITKTVTTTITNEVEVPGPTVTVEVPVDPDPNPGHFLEPLKFATYLLDDNGAWGLNGPLESHMHVDEVRYRESDGKLFYCSYTWGVIDASDPADATYLAQGYDWDMFISPVDRDTGCLHVDWDDQDEDIVYASHRGNYDFQPHLTAIDLASYSYYDYEEEEEVSGITPVLGLPLQEPDVSYEGLDYAEVGGIGYVFVALHAGGIGVFQYNPVTTGMDRITESVGIVPNAYDIHVVDEIAYVVDEHEGLYILDVSDVYNITEISHLYIGGIDRDVRYDNGYVYIAAGTPGFAIVDVQDPANPTLESLTPAYSTVTRLGVHNDRVATAGWIDTRVYDVTNKSAPAIIGGVRIPKDKSYSNDPSGERSDITARILGMDIYEDWVFVGNWWIPYVYEIMEDGTRTAPYLVLTEDVYYMSAGSVDPGMTGTYTFTASNDGNEPLTIWDTWVTNDKFVVTPTTAVIQPGGEQDFTVTFTAGPDLDEYLEPVEESGIVYIHHDDPNQGVAPFADTAAGLRKGFVIANAGGLDVGDPFPQTLGTDVVTGNLWDSSVEFAGKVGLVAYFATF
jgi:hypothetical protein